MYAIGYDIGSSSVKAALVVIATGAVVTRQQEPATEMSIAAPKPGWAEQDPAAWWTHLCTLTQRIITETGIEAGQIQSVGISYQMHGLVLVDEQLEVVRPAIIWCDSRAIPYGDAAFERIGKNRCLAHCLNSPSNFTAAKWKWVQEKEPDNYAKTRYAMLPGDYISMRLSGQVNTTSTGLSEGVMWDFTAHEPASIVLQDMKLPADQLPPLVATVSPQAHVSTAGADATGLPSGIPIGYRAGDQPNNALSLNVLEPGEVAATAGTSGVVYGVTDRLVYDPQQRINSFAHVNHRADQPRIGVLLCINGAGILLRWLRQNLVESTFSYGDMEQAAQQVPIGAEGLVFLPFGNGAERMLNNQQIGAQLAALDLNLHLRSHMIRAGIEGVAFAFVYGMQIMQELGVDLSRIRVGNDNLFQSSIFAETVATLTGATIEMHNTTGAVGAALAGAVGSGLIDNLREATSQQEIVATIAPQIHKAPYVAAYQKWKHTLEKVMP
ncbi:MAG: FGGY family carbohydrate kinase [Bacteroidota bacterium]